MKRQRAVVITGFEPFGGYARNSSAEIARRLDGAVIAGVPIIGRVLPVDMAKLPGALKAIFDEIDPVAAILLGLAVGEAVIRLERVAFNRVDFTIPDNAGALIRDRPIDPHGGPALSSRLPLRAIQTKLLAMGIPARLSETAGTYLCNAAFYRALSDLPARVPCGFVHLPLLPAQVAQTIGRTGASDAAASMAFPMQRRAVEIVIEIALDSPAEKTVERGPQAARAKGRRRRLPRA